MKNIPELFGSMVFNESVMRARLPKETYKALKRTIARGKSLDPDLANVVANAMKDWAIEKGATHYTHWFQPMTGVTAEKHDSFIAPDGNGIIMEFSGKSLVQGESDASSFPSGGLRSTFEARGYTAWDPTSYAFIKNDTLYIPTAFCSYGGEALDKKTPLLRSMEAIDRQALRILRLFGREDVRRVITTVGPEQEYFLVDREVYEKRPDLVSCNRTLFGARPTKGQELDDHYFGTIKPRVQAFMRELDEELWKLGVLAKTEHNEAAPAQHELAPIFSTTNIAVDHNQLTMELLKTIARKHDLVCLLHEKPFKGVSGSGKHNNWSLSTDTGINLLEPGETPAENAQFLLFLTAVIKAVDEHQDLLRCSIASAGNDHRLGVHEAPPAIISMFLGDELTAILESVENGTLYEQKEKRELEIGARVLPHFPTDATDRNRTSPFAFTGNKFEFRMLGSSFSVSEPNVVLNTIVADQLMQFADELEKGEFSNTAVFDLVRRTLKEHHRIIFNGNNYSDEWVEEAERRGLLNLHTTVDAMPHWIQPDNIALFGRHGVYSSTEMYARCDIALENYCKIVNIEALTMIDMTKKDILPAVIAYQKTLAETANAKKLFDERFDVSVEKELLANIADHATAAVYALHKLEQAVYHETPLHDAENAAFYKDTVLTTMEELRNAVDELETLVGRAYWPYPSYSDLLYSVK